MSLPAAPSALLQADGQAAFGVYQGIVADLAWGGLARRFHHKRWQYAALAHEDFFIGCAVVDVGWCGTAFAYLFDRRQGEVTAAFSADELPGLRPQVEDRVFGHARFRRNVQFTRAGDALSLSVRSRKLNLQADIPLSGPVLASIAPANHSAHSTHKSGALPASGWVEAAGERRSLDGAAASLDYSNGQLARHTDWRWASAHAPGLGFNLQQGFMGAEENALWLDGELCRVGAATFHYDKRQPLAPWRIKSADGCVDLVFTPEGARREDKNLLIAASRYVQPVGRFNGTLKHPESGRSFTVENLLGVTEDHASRW